jgi:hypothetical protein
MILCPSLWLPVAGNRSPCCSLLAALALLRTERTYQNLLLVGCTANECPDRLHDRLSLRALYSAADVMLILTRLASLANTGALDDSL